MRILFLLILVALVAVEVRLWILWRLHGRKVKMLMEMKEELDKMWNRIEWLCEDTDNRLSVDRVELQQRALQIKNLQIRTKTIEKYLYLDAKDAFKEQEDGNDD